MRYLTAGVLMIVALGAIGVAEAGDIYCNNQGRDCSDRPSPGATVVRALPPPPAANEPSPSDSTNSNPVTGAANGPVDAAANERLKQDATRQNVEKDVAAFHAQQCKEAKDKYQQAIEARRVYRINKAGEREYLSDNEAELARVNARLEMDRSCGGTAPAG